MRNAQTPITLEAIEELLDRKLDEKLDEKLDLKLKPIERRLGSLESEIGIIKNEIGTIKDVLENRVYKEMKEGFKRLELLAQANIEDHLMYDRRISALEKHSGISSKN